MAGIKGISGSVAMNLLEVTKQPSTVFLNHYLNLHYLTLLMFVPIIYLSTEDMLGKVASNGRRVTDRKALLFDGLLVLCKPSGGKRVSVTVAAVHPAHQGELRLKERFFIRKVDIIDREDTEGK